MVQDQTQLNRYPTQRYIVFYEGIIVTARIEAIKPDDFDDRILTLNYNSRWFILRAVKLHKYRTTKILEIDGYVLFIL